MASHESMSSNAAAFSIANLLNSDTKPPETLSTHQKNKQESYDIRSLLQTTQSEPPQFLPSCFNTVRNYELTSNNLARFPMREVQVALQQSDLWWKFYSCGTEMVITRTGRWDIMGGSFLSLSDLLYLWNLSWWDLPYDYKCFKMYQKKTLKRSPFWMVWRALGY